MIAIFLLTFGAWGIGSTLLFKKRWSIRVNLKRKKYLDFTYILLYNKVVRLFAKVFCIYLHLNIKYNGFTFNRVKNK
jgi:hypothetical protein